MSEMSEMKEKKEKDDGDLLICRCEEVSRRQIEEALDVGLITLNEIKRKTRAGMGLCQGRTCSRLIIKMISEKYGINPGDIAPASRRAPVRPVEMAIFADENDEPAGHGIP
jgi:NAD(P)H-nitrite reductase large subunit